MTDNNRDSQCENTRAIVRSAIRDSRAISVQARIRITRIERGIAKLHRLRSIAPNVVEANRIELKLTQSLRLREQALRSLVSAETHLQGLLEKDKKGFLSYQPNSAIAPNKQSAPTGSET